MATVLIAGGTGLIGKRLSELLVGEGYAVRHLSRHSNPSAPFPAYSWNPDKGFVDPAALEGVDYIIHLAGAGIADKRWSEERKNAIISSRVNGARTLRDAILTMPTKPKAYIAASAIGFYGHRDENWMEEFNSPGTGFLPESCVAWENATNEVAQTGIRTVALRIGIVLSEKGGALEKLVLPLRFHVAPNLGNGLQWYSWIHISDVCNMFLFAIRNESMEGIFNAVAPFPVRLQGLMREMVRILGIRAVHFSIPAAFLRIGMGEMASVVLDSTKVSAKKIESTGFQFQFPEIRPALKDLLLKSEE